MTTILAVKKDDQVAIAGDGQVTLGEKVIMKHSAKKVRTSHNHRAVSWRHGSGFQRRRYETAYIHRRG